MRRPPVIWQRTLTASVMTIQQMRRAPSRSAWVLMIATIGAVAIQCGPAGQQSASQAGADAASTKPARQPRTWLHKSNAEMMAMRDGNNPGPDFTKQFSKNVAQVKMRDGAELHTKIYAPLDQKEALPIIWFAHRTASTPIRTATQLGCVNTSIS
jgi:predicted acyl esterase